MNTTLHAIALLKGHIFREEQALAAEKSTLNDLRRNLEAKEIVRNRRAVKVCHRPSEKSSFRLMRILAAEDLAYSDQCEGRD